MRILIIEDEPLAAKKLKGLVKEINPDAEILSVLESVDESLEWLKANDHPDIILSDIHLSDGICFNIYSRIEVECPIIFVTPHTHITPT